MQKLGLPPVRRILVPTDFSDSAANAVEYACLLAQRIDAGILLYHAIHLPVVIYSEQVEMLPTMPELEKEAMHQLKKIKSEVLVRFPKLDVDVLSSTGFAVEEISNVAAAHTIDLVVMGTTGASGLKEILIGSNTADVMESAGKPVLSVPSEARFTGFKHIVFATNYEDNDFQTLYLLAMLMKPFGTKISVVHMQDSEEQVMLESKRFKWFKEQVANNIPYDNFSFDLTSGKDINEVLNNYSANHSIDLIALCMRKRRFFKKLLSRSVTKKMAYHSKIPLLAFHVPDNASATNSNLTK